MESLWSASCEIPERDSLKGDITTQTVVIGAGIAGILTAFLLQEKGIETVVIEATKIAGGQTKNTTAKITAQHDIIYNKLIEDFGEEKARQYAKANMKAIDEYERIINQLGIDCEFERLSNYVYTLASSEPLRVEAQAAKSLGLPAAFCEESRLPFIIAGAVEFKNQAQFHPLKFISTVAEKLKVYENTFALEVKDNTVYTNKGKINAKNLVVTTHFPFINFPGYYFLRMHRSRSYVIALENAQHVDGMYIDAGEEGYSFRNYKDLLLLGGGSHRTGEKPQESAYDKLSAFANSYYPNSKEVYRWSAQDCMPVDSVPYIGNYSESTPCLYVATGFRKWGMSSSMVSAMLLSDRIAGIENDCAGIFDPARFKLTKSFKDVMGEGSTAVKNLLEEVFVPPKESIDMLPEGTGNIVEYNGHKVGVYKNGAGKSYIVSTRCPHLGCQLSWNQDDLMWECPCHGSRFHFDGTLVDNPAQTNITEK